MRLGLVDTHESTNVASCHSWSCSLGLDDDRLPDDWFPSRLDNPLEMDIRNHTNTLVVGEGVGLVEQVAIESKRETTEGPRQRWTQGGGGTRSTQRVEVLASCCDGRACCCR